MDGQGLWLPLEEAVGGQGRAEVYDEVVHRTVAGVHEVGLVLQQVVDALDDVPFAEHDFVPEGHELVLHVGLDSVHQVYALAEEALEEFLLDVSPVGEHFPIEFLDEYTPHLRVSVVHVRPCETERYALPQVVAHNVQLEAVAPSHRTLAVGGETDENLVETPPHVVAHGYHRAVHEGDIRAFPEGHEPHEEHHGQEHAGHQLHEAVVRHGGGELAPRLI